MVPLHRAALPAAVLVLGIAAVGHTPAPAQASARSPHAPVVSAEAPLVARVQTVAAREGQFDTGISTTVPPTTVAPGSAAAAEVVAITNAQRTARGLAEVRVDSRLTQAALIHAQDQAAMNRMSHTGSDGSDAGQRISRAGYDFRTWGENVAAGYTTAVSVMDGWMNSTGHRANILNTNFVDIGVAVAYANDGTAYWTMVLAA